MELPKSQVSNKALLMYIAFAKQKLYTVRVGATPIPTKVERKVSVRGEVGTIIV